MGKFIELMQWDLILFSLIFNPFKECIKLEHLLKQLVFNQFIDLFSDWPPIGIASWLPQHIHVVLHLIVSSDDSGEANTILSYSREIVHHFIHIMHMNMILFARFLTFHCETFFMTCNLLVTSKTIIEFTGISARCSDIFHEIST